MLRELFAGLVPVALVLLAGVVMAEAMGTGFGRLGRLSTLAKYAIAGGLSVVAAVILNLVARTGTLGIVVLAQGIGAAGVAYGLLAMGKRA